MERGLVPCSSDEDDEMPKTESHGGIFGQAVRVSRTWAPGDSHLYPASLGMTPLTAAKSSSRTLFADQGHPLESPTQSQLPWHDWNGRRMTCFAVVLSAVATVLVVLFRQVVQLSGHVETDLGAVSLTMLHNYQMELGVSYSYSQIEEFTAASQEACESFCTANKRCTVYTFTALTSPGWHGNNCYLHGEGGVKVSQPGAVSGLKWWHYTTTTTLSLTTTSSTISTTTTTTTAISTTTSTTTSTVTTTTTTTTTSGYEVQLGVAFRYSEVAWQNVSTIVQCEHTCSSNADCAAFTFYRSGRTSHAGGNCLLFSDTETTSADSDAISGVKPGLSKRAFNSQRSGTRSSSNILANPSDLQEYTVEEGVAYWYADIAESKLLSLDSCKARCTSSPHCAVYTFFIQIPEGWPDRNCFLHGVTESKTFIDFAVSGRKEGVIESNFE